MLNNADVRTELALLGYDQNLYQIHEREDAFTTLDKILSIIHAWMASCNLYPNGVQMSLHDCLDLGCGP